MRQLSVIPALCLAGLMAVWMAGCGETPPANTTTETPEHSAESHGHDAHEGEHGHEHEGHGHPDKGPRDGVLVMFEGHEAHLEIVFDSKEGTITAYPLDGHAEKEVPVVGDELELSVVAREGGEPSMVTLKRAEGEPVKFVGQSDALKGKEQWDGAFVNTKIGGAEYKETTFKYPEGNHDH